MQKGRPIYLKGTQEASQGIKEIKVLGKEAFFIDSVSGSAEKIARGAVRLNMFTIIPRNMIEVALIGFIVVIISVNVLLSANLGATLSILSVFAAANDQNHPINQSGTKLSQ